MYNYTIQILYLNHSIPQFKYSPIISYITLSFTNITIYNNTCYTYIDSCTNTPDFTSVRLMYWIGFRGLHLSYYPAMWVAQSHHKGSINPHMTRLIHMNWYSQFFLTLQCNIWTFFDSHHLVIFIYMILIY